MDRSARVEKVDCPRALIRVLAVCQILSRFVLQRLSRAGRKTQPTRLQTLSVPGRVLPIVSAQTPKSRTTVYAAIVLPLSRRATSARRMARY